MEGFVSWSHGIVLPFVSSASVIYVSIPWAIFWQRINYLTQSVKSSSDFLSFPLGEGKDVDNLFSLVFFDFVQI